jgi:hypothetical protein
MLPASEACVLALAENPTLASWAGTFLSIFLTTFFLGLHGFASGGAAAAG